MTSSEYIYRPDIDGLRAIAVLAVLLFHVGVTGISGGYVGVDVFFVISGYLITSIIQREISADKFSLLQFWERRIRRIIPPLVIVLLFTLVGSWLWLFPGEFREYSQSLLAQSVFASNIFFWTQTGYFATAAELKPLQHTWSLAIEEQFYLIFPWILLLVSKRLARLRLPLLLALLLASMAISFDWVLRSPEMAFYWLPSRAWELLLGSVLVYLPQKNLRPMVSQAVSLCGLGMIIAACLVYTAETRFPGKSALLPCFGAAFIIAPHVTGNRTWVYSLLSLKPMVYIGLISYSLYLWHWPLLSFARHKEGSVLSMQTSVSIIVLSFILAALSLKFVENPIRSKRLFKSTRALFSSTLVTFMLIVGVGAAGHTAEGFPERLDEAVKKMTKGFVYTNPRRGECLFRAGREVVISRACEVGVKGETKGQIKPTFLAVGDSHANSLMPLVDRLAEENGATGLFPVYNGCPPIWQIYRSDAGANHLCHDFNLKVIELVKAHQIKHVLLVGRWTFYALDGVIDQTEADGERPHKWQRRPRLAAPESTELVAVGLQRFIDELGPDVKVTIMRQGPEQDVNVTPMYLAKQMQLGVDVREMGISLDEHNDRQKVANGVIDDLVASSKDIAATDLTPFLCADGRCPVSRDGGSLYRDFNHVSTYGSQFVDPALTDFFAGVVGAKE